MKKILNMITQLMFIIMILAVVLLACSFIGVLATGILRKYGAAKQYEILNNFRYFLVGLIFCSTIIGMVSGKLESKFKE